MDLGGVVWCGTGCGVEAWVGLLRGVVEMRAWSAGFKAGGLVCWTLYEVFSVACKFPGPSQQPQSFFE